MRRHLQPLAYDLGVKHLCLVQPAEPDEQQAVIERVKRMHRPLGIVQCNRCGSRTVLTLTAGARIDESGKYHRGTVFRDRVCAECHRQGIFTPMLPDPPKLATAPKPRRTKPKPVK